MQCDMMSLHVLIFSYLYIILCMFDKMMCFFLQYIGCCITFRWGTKQLWYMRRMAQLTSTSGVKGIFLLLLVIGFFSMLLQTVTYHIGINLPYSPEDPRELNSDYPQNRIVRNINSDQDVSFISQQHKGSNSQQHVSAATQQLNILSKIYKVGFLLFSKECCINSLICLLQISLFSHWQIFLNKLTCPLRSISIQRSIIFAFLKLKLKLYDIKISGMCEHFSFLAILNQLKEHLMFLWFVLKMCHY